MSSKHTFCSVTRFSKALSHAAGCGKQHFSLFPCLGSTASLASVCCLLVVLKTSSSLLTGDIILTDTSAWPITSANWTWRLESGDGNFSRPFIPVSPYKGLFKSKLLLFESNKPVAFDISGDLCKMSVKASRAFHNCLQGAEPWISAHLRWWRHWSGEMSRNTSRPIRTDMRIEKLCISSLSSVKMYRPLERLSTHVSRINFEQTKNYHISFNMVQELAWFHAFQHVHKSWQQRLTAENCMKIKRFWADFLNAVYFRRGLTCTSEITNDLMDACSFSGSFPYPASPGGRGREKSLGTRMWWTVANQELNLIYVKRSQITNRFWPGPLCFRYSRYRLSVITTTVRLIHQSIAKCHQF